MGEGDDKVSAYSWSFISCFELQDVKNKECRKVLGLVMGYLYTLSGMNLEPQDSTGRVPHKELLDPSNRVEFTSRIFVLVGNKTAVYSFPNMRKTFCAATGTFNMEQDVPEAAATKMLSIVQMCTQCPVQSQFYLMLYRFHRHRCTVTEVKQQRRKFEWWEFKMLKLIQDNELADHSLDTVATHLISQRERWQNCSHSDDVIAAVCSETQVERTRIG